MTFSKAILIGVAQVFALIPGASRLGVCTTMSRLLGVSRWKGVTFSFILSIPVLAGAVALTGYDMIKDNSLHTVFHLWPAILMTFALSLAFLPALEWYLKRYTFVPFALYRLLFGGFLVYEAFKLGNGVPF